jgi:hypothetical protein
MADTLTWVAADAYRDASGVRRQLFTELARDGDDEPWPSDNLFRWGPAFGAPPEDEEESDKDEAPDALDEDDFDLAEDPLSPDVPSTTSTSAPGPNRRMRRKAAVRRRRKR